MASYICLSFAILLSLLISVCSGVRCSIRNDYYIFYKDCYYGCCGYRDSECCTGPIGLITGLSVGGAILLFVLILTVCLCRRRRYRGLVYRSQPPTMVVQQSTVTGNSGMVSTASVQPGVTYPPYQYYQYPSAPAYPPQPMPYAAAPPAYDTLQQDGGIANKGYQ